MTPPRLPSLIALSILALTSVPRDARAEAWEFRLSRGYGILSLPLFVVDHEKLIEKHAKAGGVGEVKVSWRILDGGNVINDAKLAGALDIAAIGVPGFVPLWAETQGNSRLEGAALSGLSSPSLSLNTPHPAVKTAP